MSVVIRPKEADLQAGVADWLEVVKPDCLWTHVANEAPRMKTHNRDDFARVGAKLKRQGVKTWPGDMLFVGCRLQPAAFYEIKRRGGRLTDGQREGERFCAARGIPYEWMASDDLEEHIARLWALLIAWGGL